MMASRKRAHETPEDPPQRPEDPPRVADPVLLAFLVCPMTGMDLVYDAVAQKLVNVECGIIYPIVDGIPIMVPEEAIQGAPVDRRGRRR